LIVFSPDSKTLVIGGNDGTLKLCDTLSLRELLTLRGDHWITSAVFSPDGKKLATFGSSNLRVWRAPAAAIEIGARREGP
jgi:WD40 repeat protein